MKTIKINTEKQKRHDLMEELKWFSSILSEFFLKNIKNYDHKLIYQTQPPKHNIGTSLFAQLIQKNNFRFEERFTMMLAIAPHIDPVLLDKIKTYPPIPELGGQKGKNHHGFIPTGETLLFLLSGRDVSLRLELLNLFDKGHAFYKENLIALGPTEPNEPKLSGALTPSKDLLDLATKGVVNKPDFDTDFPAKLITTEMNWEDLVLPKSVIDGINEIKVWISHGETLMNDWGMSKKLKKGYRSLFYGPPGTGKTLTATLLGKHTGRDVYRIDLSMVVSKYIGETEKNLSKIFDRAEHKDWILFFDEADALFGKRTNVNDSHDKYANQEISFLLQRIEDYNGLVILASNMKTNIDEAFTRRFQSVIHFPMPKIAEKIALWENAFSSKSDLESRVKIEDLAAKYELSGGAIMNVSRYSSLMALSKNSTVISLADIEEGIKKELEKEGRIM